MRLAWTEILLCGLQWLSTAPITDCAPTNVNSLGGEKQPTRYKIMTFFKNRHAARACGKPGA